MYRNSVGSSLVSPESKCQNCHMWHAAPTEGPDCADERRVTQAGYQILLVGGIFMRPSDRSLRCRLGACCGKCFDGTMHRDTVDLGNDVFMMDTRMGGYEDITSSYLIRSSKPCLVETGSARSAPVVVEQLAQLGIGPADLATIVVTHIHLDHAGGVGDLAETFPNADVVVQERGARHLADPSRLVASAQRVFGEAMDRLFGDLQPTPATRIVSIAERGEVDLGDGRHLAAFHNPGHASHHIGLVDSATGDLYTGDAAGVYVPETADVRPATPPPDFDLDLTLSSLAAMREVGPTRLLFSHFGPVTEIDEVLDASIDELHAWVDTVRAAREISPDLDHAVAMVREKARVRHGYLYEDSELLAKQEELSSTTANVAGIMRWLDLQARDR